MKILILGGTLFLGRHLVEAAQASGHRVTIFHRGKTKPDLYANVESLRGDRDGDLDALHGRQWNAAIDSRTQIALHQVPFDKEELRKEMRHSGMPCAAELLARW